MLECEDYDQETQLRDDLGAASADRGLERRFVLARGDRPYQALLRRRLEERRGPVDRRPRVEQRPQDLS